MSVQLIGNPQAIPQPEPPEGRLAFNLVPQGQPYINFAAITDVFEFDSQNLGPQLTRIISGVLSLWLDAANLSAGNLVLQTNFPQAIVTPSGSQQYIIPLGVKPFRFTLTATGTGIVGVAISNYNVFATGGGNTVGATSGAAARGATLGPYRRP